MYLICFSVVLYCRKKALLYASYFKHTSQFHHKQFPSVSRDIYILFYGIVEKFTF